MNNIMAILLGFIACLIYGILGYTASGETWDTKKYLRTVVIAFAVILGINITAITENAVYVFAISPIAIVVVIEKLLNTAIRKAK